MMPNKIIFIGDSFVVRLRQSLAFITLISLIISEHEELWHLDFKSLFKLFLLILLGLNGSPVGKDRKQ